MLFGPIENEDGMGTEKTALEIPLSANPVPPPNYIRFQRVSFFPGRHLGARVDKVVGLRKMVKSPRFPC